MDLAAGFRDWATWAEGNAPLYERLAHVVADDPELLALAERVPEGKTPWNVLFASVHASLLDDPDHELGEFYPTIVEAPFGYDDPRDREHPRDPDDPDLPDVFADFCAEREAELVEYFETRRTQTNAVRRCAALYPAITRVTLEAGAAPALIEVGASAGLNLLFDRYAYEFDYSEADAVDDGVRKRVGVRESPVTIDSAVHAGDPPIPSDPPPVACRIGVDLNPLDPADPDDRRWLRALAWPEHEARHRVLEPALELAAADPPTVVEGDALERLPELVAEVPDDVPICVFDTLVLYQFPPDARERFETTLQELGEDHELYWIAGEGEHEEHEHGIPLDCSRPGDGESERLGTFEMHGRWLRWSE